MGNKAIRIVDAKVVQIKKEGILVLLASCQLTSEMTAILVVTAVRNLDSTLLFHSFPTMY
jgi:hypothetical protein